jgi:hypothetical protein
VSHGGGPPPGSVNANSDAYSRFFGRGDEERMRGLATGFPILDQRIGGLSGIWGLGAPSAHGKTTLAMTMASHIVVKLQVPAIFLSLEMSAQAIQALLVAHVLATTRRAVESGDCDGEQERVFTRWRKRNGSRFAVFSRGDCPTPKQVEAWPGWIEAGGDTPRGLVVVDSIQKLARFWHPDAENETEALDLTLDDLLTLVDKRGLTFLCISRLPKGATAQHFVYRGSGSQEYDFDVALTLAAKPRPLASPGRVPIAGTPVELTIHKNRAGESGFKVKFLRLDSESRMVER